MDEQTPTRVLLLYLIGKGLSKACVGQLIQDSCCGTLVVEIPNCVWGKDKMVVMTEGEKKADEAYSVLESATWF